MLTFYSELFSLFMAKKVYLSGNIRLTKNVGSIGLCLLYHLHICLYKQHDITSMVNVG